MAKLYGCYEALEGGHTDEALATLTGFPCERIELRKARASARTARCETHEGIEGRVGSDADDEEGVSADMVWARLLSFYEAGFLLSASVGATDEGEAAAAEAMGLLTEHAYSLLKVVGTRRTGSGEPVRLVKLRNPWGKLEWRGDWSDSSPLWTSALRAELDDGDIGRPAAMERLSQAAPRRHTPRHR